MRAQTLYGGIIGMFWLWKATAGEFWNVFIYIYCITHNQAVVDFIGRMFFFFPNANHFSDGDDAACVQRWRSWHSFSLCIRSEKKEESTANPSTSTRIKVCCGPAVHENTTSWSSVRGPAVIVSCQTCKVLPHSFAPDILLPFIYFSHSLVFRQRHHSWPNLAPFLPPCAPSRDDGRVWRGSCTF